MKKYIIIILSFLGLLFVNVGIVSANGTASSKLTATEVEEIRDRIKEAGLPINNRDNFSKDYKDWTDYVIFIPASRLGIDNNVHMVLYTRSSNDIDGWQVNGSGSIITQATTSKYYYLKYDTFKKWYWDDLGRAPIKWDKPVENLTNGYIFYATERVTQTIDNGSTFFPTSITSGKDEGSDKDDGILGAVSNFIKSIFMPDKKVLNDMINDTKAHLESKLPFLGKESEIKGIFGSEKSMKDVGATYGNRVIECLDCEKDVSTPYLGRFNFKVIDSEYLNKGIDKFRPIIRGFLVLMLLFYNFNQFFGFIGQRFSVTSGKGEA